MSTQKLSPVEGQLVVNLHENQTRGDGIVIGGKFERFFKGTIVENGTLNKQKSLGIFEDVEDEFYELQPGTTVITKSTGAFVYVDTNQFYIVDVDSVIATIEEQEDE